MTTFASVYACDNKLAFGLTIYAAIIAFGFVILALVQIRKHGRLQARSFKCGCLNGRWGQLYLGSKVNTVSTSVMALRRFSKITLAPGETKTVSFIIDASDVALWNRKMQLVGSRGRLM